MQVENGLPRILVAVENRSVAVVGVAPGLSQSRGAPHHFADERVVERLTPYAEHMWDIEGLGEELVEENDGEHRTEQEECHPAESQHST